jgi:hypothetical protein
MKSRTRPKNEEVGLSYWVATFGCLRHLKFDIAICERNWKL